MVRPMLWKLQYASAETFGNAGTFAEALRQHLRYTRAGLVSVLQQIDQEQSAYLVQAGCTGCALGGPAGGACVPGCRIDLLRRVLTTGYAESALVLVRRGLMERPYTRTAIAWPGVGARSLDASVLHGWPQARLQLHWRLGTGSRQALRASAVLCVGDGADDPLERLQAIGWHGLRLPSRLSWWRGQPRPAPRLAARAWPGDPYVLTPLAAGTQWLMTPPSHDGTALDAGLAVGYGNAAAIVQHLHDAGARVEMLDLLPDGWTARVAATTTTGDDPRPIWEAMRAPGAPLELRDAATGTLLLDPSQARPNGVLGPLLLLGTRSDGVRRWRPFDATHHLVLAGPIEGGVILGMVARAVQSRPDLRIGVLDLTAAGELDVALLGVPGRLTMQTSRNVSDLLGLIGGLDDQAQPVLIVLAADDADTADAALLSCLRVALYRPVSVLLVVPTRAAIPALFQARCPVVEVRRRVAQWQAPEGRWDWAQPTVLRLPWRAPGRSWPQLTAQTSQKVTSLPAVEGFWRIPPEHQGAFGLSPVGRQQLQVLPGLAMAAPSALPGAPPVTAPARDQRRCRVYDMPARAPSARGSPAGAAQPETPGMSSGETAEPLPAVPAALRAEIGEGARAAAPVRIRAQAPLPALPAPQQVAPLADRAQYSAQEDGAGNLVIDPQLLLLTLRWAEQIDPDNEGVSITRFKSGVGLPSKAHSFQLRDALRRHGLIRRELKREGWYRLLTVEEAVRAGKLPPGPWYTPPVEAFPPLTAPRAEHAAVPAERVTMLPARDGVAVAATDVVDEAPA